MRTFSMIIAAILLSVQCMSAQHKTNYGRLEEYHDFESAYITPRTVRVWLPDGYSDKERYDVMYMHDGQMLFDADSTWNHQEWMVDENFGRLMETGAIRPCIVVAVDNIKQSRYGDYFPQKTLDYLEAGTSRQDDIAYNADNYLKFLVMELKPFIDSHYSTRKSARHTFVMGSSMGGLISLYALCEYPDVFGGAACLSTHVPMVLSSTLPNPLSDVYAEAFRAYLRDNLPKADSRLIYMDRGDMTLDAHYPAYQDAIDSLMRELGWNEDSWVSMVFPGEAHTETFWAGRLHLPIIFLLGR